MLENGIQRGLPVGLKQGLKLPEGPKEMASETQGAVKLRVSDTGIYKVLNNIPLKYLS